MEVRPELHGESLFQTNNNKTKSASKDVIKRLHLKLSSYPCLAPWLTEAHIFTGSASVATNGELRTATSSVQMCWGGGTKKREDCKTINTLFAPR